VPKIAEPAECSDFRPVLLVPVFSRVIERIIIRRAIYPALPNSSVAVLLADQFAFRPTGSTTAALVSILSNLSEMSQEHYYVHLIALDFSKAFDTVQHHTLMSKMAVLALPDFVYNWIGDYISGRKHCTRSIGAISSTMPKNASVVQGSAMGPVGFIINGTDLKCMTQGNQLCKYADDTYMIVPSAVRIEVSQSQRSFSHIESWASNINLKLNTTKSQEMIVRRPRARKTIILSRIGPPAYSIGWLYFV